MKDLLAYLAKYIPIHNLSKASQVKIRESIPSGMQKEIGALVQT